ncbi:MAG: hypothetical protein ACJ79S_01620 [Gemmatimonadaceae bacterium]
MAKSQRSFRGPDGTEWAIEVRSPGASNAMIVFNHPDGRTSRLNRYAWYIWHGPEARDVTARITPREVQDALTDRDVARLFRRSMPISTDVPAVEP